MRQAHSSLLKKSKDTRGAVLVEFALMLPLLIIILLLIFDLGWMIRAHQILQNGAREGARFSALPRNQISPLNPSASVADIKQRVIEYCREENIVVGSGEVAVSQTVPITVGVLTLRGSQVIVTHRTSFLIPAGHFLPATELNLVGQSVFRNLY